MFVVGELLSCCDSMAILKFKIVLILFYVLFLSYSFASGSNLLLCVENITLLPAQTYLFLIIFSFRN